MPTSTQRHLQSNITTRRHPWSTESSTLPAAYRSCIAARVERDWRGGWCSRIHPSRWCRRNAWEPCAREAIGHARSHHQFLPFLVLVVVANVSIQVIPGSGYLPRRSLSAARVQRPAHIYCEPSQVILAVQVDWTLFAKDQCLKRPTATIDCELNERAFVLQ